MGQRGKGAEEIVHRPLPLFAFSPFPPFQLDEEGERTVMR